MRASMLAVRQYRVAAVSAWGLTLSQLFVPREAKPMLKQLSCLALSCTASIRSDHRRKPTGPYYYATKHAA